MGQTPRVHQFVALAAITISLLMAATAFNFRKLVRAIALFLAFLSFARVKHGSCQNELYLAA
jgi:hypothetical protein